jgi:Xaa-Pro aminopeptidase
VKLKFAAESGQLKISARHDLGGGANGAIVHYRPTTKSRRLLEAGSLYLIDSGAQYRESTTDVTRTIAIGTPTAEMRRHYGLVLKAHIAIAAARFPKGTRGQDLDPYARRPLWEAGLDFDHGTGHGVGSYLSVHEGPQRLSRLGTVALEPGMILSNEPGYYREGQYGIRLENLVLVTPLEKIQGGTREMMGFETLTLVPFDRRLIDPKQLLPFERDWLNAYHAEVRRRIGPLLNGADRLAPPCHGAIGRRDMPIEIWARLSRRRSQYASCRAAHHPLKETRATSLFMYAFCDRRGALARVRHHDRTGRSSSQTRSPCLRSPSSP